MLNFRKVENYTAERINLYKDNYPKEITEGLKAEAHSGSFGACLLCIKYENGNPHNLAEVDYKYIARYSDIDAIISHLITRNYGLLAAKYYEKHREEQKKGMTCHLEIFNDSQKVNEFYYTDSEQVKSELVKILISEKRRGTRTTYKPIPYSNDMKIIQKWSREQAGTTCSIKYVYHFRNLDY